MLNNTREARVSVKYSFNIKLINTCISIKNKIIYHIFINIFIILKYVIKICQATGNINNHNKSEFIIMW